MDNSSQEDSDASASGQSAEDDRPRVPCPLCGELILEVARKCKHCGEFKPPTGAAVSLDPPPPSSSPPPASLPQPLPPPAKSGFDGPRPSPALVGQRSRPPQTALRSATVPTAPLTSGQGMWQRIDPARRVREVRSPWLKVPAALGWYSIAVSLWATFFLWTFCVFVLFGIFALPLRLMGRGRRRHKRGKLRHAELLDAIERSGQR
jgi:hypothetical protein